MVGPDSGWPKRGSGVCGGSSNKRAIMFHMAFKHRGKTHNLRGDDAERAGGAVQAVQHRAFARGAAEVRLSGGSASQIAVGENPDFVDKIQISP